MTIGGIYDAMNEIAPFCDMDRGDNSGLLVGNREDTVTKALIALDITNDVIDEAREIGAELIISHHPVFNFRYEEFNTIGIQTPIYNLAYNKIGAICSHTTLDVAVGGINDIILDMLREPFSLCDDAEIFERINDRVGYGKIVTVGKDITPEEMAKTLKEIFGCTVVKYCKGRKKIKRMAFCSGGGGSLTRMAIAKGADAYICGDVKHDQWISAVNNGISLFDCGHYHTEVIMVNYLKNRLAEKIQGVEFVASRKGTDPCCYEV